MDNTVDGAASAYVESPVNPAVAERLPPTSGRPVRPRVVSSSLHVTDITNKFCYAASRLVSGTLVKDDQFTLLESVGALEIGDPKMDSGCTLEGETFDDEFDVRKRLSPGEVIWLMDELLSREVAWHMGYPLSQTIFTSVHIESLLWPDPISLYDAQFGRNLGLDDTDLLTHRIFRSYCLGLLKSCDLILSMVTSQHYYEEEDFATQLYNRELLHRFSVEEVLHEMQEALPFLQSLELDSANRTSLESRINFRMSFLQMLSRHTGGYDSSTFDPIMEPGFLETIQTTRAQGTPIPDAFSLKIQRRLTSTVPPRPMIVIDDTKAFDYLTQFLRDCKNVFAVRSASHSQDLLASYSAFSAQVPQPSVYVRALMQLWLNEEKLTGSASNHLEFMADDMQSVTMPASIVLQVFRSTQQDLAEPFATVHQLTSEFLAKNERSFLNIWRTMCLNRCRIRRTLCHAALEWDNIQAEAEELDEEFQTVLGDKAIVYPDGGTYTYSYSISSWVYHYKLLQLRLIAQLGFELEVYAPHEFASMYWYLSHLCDTHLAHLDRVSFFVTQREAGNQLQSIDTTLTSRQRDECRDTLSRLYRQFSWLKATEATARALHGLYTVLKRHGQLMQPSTTYSSDSLRYELRMRPFSYLSIPEPTTFEQGQRLAMMEKKGDLEVLDQAGSQAMLARKAWEEVMKAKWNSSPLKPSANPSVSSVIDDLWNDDVRGAIKASIGAGIAIAALKKHLQKHVAGPEGSVYTSIPKRGDKDHWHAWWVVPRLNL